jgi:hypothetical protein
MLAGASLFVAEPAHAAGLTVDVTCESLGRFRIFCERTIAGGTAPFTTRWAFNGTFFSANDNRTFTSWGCTQGAPNMITAVVTDATGATAQDSSSAPCIGGLP